MDDDCDTQIDEGVQLTFYQDSDGDGFGNLNATTQACAAPCRYLSNSTDCNDNNTSIFPGATEVCNNLDDNCDSQIDENNVCCTPDAGDLKNDSDTPNNLMLERGNDLVDGGGDPGGVFGGLFRPWRK